MLWFNEVTKEDVPLVGGKSASLGEMTSKTKVPVPYGFALTAEAYRLFVRKNGLDRKIVDALEPLSDSNDTVMLQKVGAELRKMVISAQMPKELERVIVDAYHEGILRELYHLFVTDDLAILQRIWNLSILCSAFRFRYEHDSLRWDILANDLKRLLIYIVDIRSHSTLDHVLAQPIVRFNHYHRIVAVRGINREHYSAGFGVAHHLNDRR